MFETRDPARRAWERVDAGADANRRRRPGHRSGRVLGGRHGGVRRSRHVPLDDGLPARRPRPRIGLDASLPQPRRGRSIPGRDRLRARRGPRRPRSPRPRTRLPRPAAAGQAPPMLIRRETDADVPSIDAVHHAAFARDDGKEPPEVRLVQRLRADQGWVPALSLVAEHPTSGLVGHVVCTVGALDDQAALGLGPLGVLPVHQRSGVGHALMHAVAWRRRRPRVRRRRTPRTPRLLLALRVRGRADDRDRPTRSELGRALPGATTARLDRLALRHVPVRRPVLGPLTLAGRLGGDSLGSETEPTQIA